MPTLNPLPKLRRALVLAPVAVFLFGTPTAGATWTSSVSNAGLEGDVRNDTAVSSNWSGYAVASSTTFTSVSGRWVQPTANCTSSRSTYSAGTIADSAWSPTTIQLIEDVGSPFAASQATSTGAVPTELSSDGSAFAVAWNDAIPVPTA